MSSQRLSEIQANTLRLGVFYITTYSPLIAEESISEAVQPIQSFVPTGIFSLLQGNCEGRIQHSVQQLQEKKIYYFI